MKFKIALFLISFLYSLNILADTDPAILPTVNPDGWIIKMESSVYQIVVTEDEKVQHVYYGPAEQVNYRQKNSLWTEGIDEIPVRGGFPSKTPLLEVIYNDGVRDVELQFTSADIVQIDGINTLKITQRDISYSLEVNSFIRPIIESDIIEKWVEIRNYGARDTIMIENLQSGSFSLSANEYELFHMAGRWGHEFLNRQTSLTEGLKSLVSRDFKSFDVPNWFLIRPNEDIGNHTGPSWYGTVEYSGNWRIDFEKVFNDRLQIVGGINFWDTHWNLSPNQSLITPKFIFGYTDLGPEEASRNLRQYIRKNILPENHRTKLRPILYNSWYATTFNVNEEHQIELAKVAKDIGVELFVIDDGWFKGRKNDRAGLGDWIVDEEKFPNGLTPLINEINEMGMDFGIWIEPEMVNPDSDLYRKHPEWVFYFPNRKQHEGRNQLMLNLAREDVYVYLLSSISKLLEENNIKFIKWDHNRILSDPGWPSEPIGTQKEVRIRYVNNLYRLIDTLRVKFPNVIFEDCSSGGGRIDLGMLSRMDQAWISDNTDPVDRLFIQYGYLNAFPANTMVSWITHEDWHGIRPTLDYRFDVAMCGVLGVGFDITKWTADEKEIARNKIRQYKKIRELVQFGDLYRLLSPFTNNKTSLQFVDESKSKSVVFCFNMAEYISGKISNVNNPKVLKLEGLNPKSNYKIPMFNNKIFSGKFLMDIGVDWPVRGAFKSMIVEIYEVNN